MKAKITPKNIMNFIEGNVKMLGDKINALPKFQREQVIWRSEICKDDCMVEGRCKYCGCSVPGKLYVARSCNNGDRFPDIMQEEQWENYKKENNIIINGSDIKKGSE
jgi:hypothetical protein